MNKAKQFMEYVFPNLANEYITITRIDNGGVVQERHFTSIDDAIRFTNRADKCYYNTYYSVTTTDGEGRATDNLKTRSCIVLDFDKAQLGDDFSHIDILHKFKSIRCFYHCIVDSGHGWHVYIFIEPTTDLEAVEQVTKCLATLTGADPKATLKTQLMRVPDTVNIKEAGTKNHKNVKIVWLAPDDKVKRLSISHYQHEYVTERTKRTNIEYVMRDDHTPKCAANILENGSTVGDRNSDLQTIVVALKRQGKSLAEIRAVVAEWLANTEAMNDLEYQVEYMYNNLYNGVLNCRECPHKAECYVVDTIVNNEAIADFPVLNIPNRDIVKVKNGRTKGRGKYMNANMLVIYTILLRHNKGLFRDELVEELTYKSDRKGLEPTCLFSKNIITKVLAELNNNGFVEVFKVGRKSFYKLKSNRVAEDMKFRVSYASTYECIKGSITPEELQLYCYMKYLNKVTPKAKGQDPYSLRVNQDTLARDLGVTRERITQMIGNLLDEKLLTIYRRDVSRDNGYKFNTYLLNY